MSSGATQATGPARGAGVGPAALAHDLDEPVVVGERAPAVGKKSPSTVYRGISLTSRAGGSSHIKRQMTALNTLSRTRPCPAGAASAKKGVVAYLSHQLAERNYTCESKSS
jgi:hypothetical protein